MARILIPLATLFLWCVFSLAGGEDEDVAFSFSVRILPAFEAASASFSGTEPSAACGELLSWCEVNGWKTDGVWLEVPPGREAEPFGGPFSVSARLLPVNGRPHAVSRKRKGFRLIETEPALYVAAAGRLALGDPAALRASLERRASERGYRTKGGFTLYLPGGKPEAEPVEAVLMARALPPPKADVAVWAGGGAEYTATLALSTSLFRAGATLTLLDGSKSSLDRLSDKARAVAFGGGWRPDVLSALEAGGVAAVRSFVSKGGGYLGFCAGAYLGASEAVWEGRRYKDGLGLLPCSAVGPDESIAPWPRFAMTGVLLKGPFAALLPARRAVFYWGGPCFEGRRRGLYFPLEYEKSGKPAAALGSFGKGRVFLCGPHPEYDLTSLEDGLAWPESAGLRDGEGDLDIVAGALKLVLEKND